MNDAELKEYFSYDPETGRIKRIKEIMGGKWLQVCRGRVGAVVGSLRNDGALHVRFKGKWLLNHRLAWFLHFGSWPSGEIDHINGARNDNRLANLRDVSKSRNLRNRHKKMWHTRNPDLPIGIQQCMDGKSFRVSCSVNGKRRLTNRSTIEAAVEVLEKWRHEMGYYSAK